MSQDVIKNIRRITEDKEDKPRLFITDNDLYLLKIANYEWYVFNNEIYSFLPVDDKDVDFLEGLLGESKKVSR